MCWGCGLLRKVRSVDRKTLKKLEETYIKLHDAHECNSLLKKYLTEATFNKLKKRQTQYGTTLLDVIQSGVENLNSGVGVYAPDIDAYTVFADLFDPIIEDYHGGFNKTNNQPPKDFGDLNAIGELDPDGHYIISTRVRCGRAIEGFPFNGCLTEAMYIKIERQVYNILWKLTGEYKGTYYPLISLRKSDQERMTEDNFLFKDGDRFLQAANAYRFWPTGRGIFHNVDKTFLIWVNEEDHLRIMSMQMGGDFGAVYRRLVGGINAIEARLSFSRSPHLGYLTFCPTNLGTTIRASIHIKLPKLSTEPSSLAKVAEHYHLNIRENSGEHTAIKGATYDVSNKRRLGLTEFDAVKGLYDGVAELIKLEESL